MSNGGGGGGGTGDFLSQKARIAAAAAAASASGYHSLNGGLGGSYATLASFTRLPMGTNGRADVVRATNVNHERGHQRQADPAQPVSAGSLRFPQHYGSRRSSVWSSSMTMTSTTLGGGTYRTAERSATEGRRARRDDRFTQPASTGRTWPERDPSADNKSQGRSRRASNASQISREDVDVGAEEIPAIPPPPPAQNGFILENGMLKMISTPKPAPAKEQRGEPRRAEVRQEHRRERMRRASSADRGSSLDEDGDDEEEAFVRRRRRRRRRQRAASGEDVHSSNGRFFDTLKSDKSEEELLEMQHRLEVAARQPLYQNVRQGVEDEERRRRRRRQRRQYSEERPPPPPSQRHELYGSEHIYSHLMPHNLRRAQEEREALERFQQEDHQPARRQDRRRRRHYHRQASLEDHLGHVRSANGFASVPV